MVFFKDAFERVDILVAVGFVIALKKARAVHFCSSVDKNFDVGITTAYQVGPGIEIVKEIPLNLIFDQEISRFIRKASLRNPSEFAF